MAEIEFSELGLTKNEGKAYEALVKFGKLSASEVSKHSGVSYSRIYDVLDSLANKGLVEVVPEKTKKFVPTDPASLLKLVEEKEKALEKTRAKIKEMKRFYEVKEKNPVIMGVGRKAFYKIVEEMRVLTRYDEETKKSVEKWLKIYKTIKKFDNEGVAIGVTDEEVLISLIKSNVTLLIRDGPFTKIMSKLFSAAYEKAEPIK